ncbi:MAG TPA: CHAT domain-containing protein [Gemmatimonadaceae bacterium]|nr:CHAT domain-containing protein [Gemmatimonadaceae bacterium]
MRVSRIGALTTLAAGVALTLALAAAASPAARPHVATSSTADPRAVVREATRAVERDGVAAALRARLTERLRADTADRDAMLGMATLSRLTYDYDDAERRYRSLFEGAPSSDRYAVYARLGLAQAQDTHGRRPGQERLLDDARAGAHAAGDRAAEGEALYWQSQSLGSVYGGGFAIAKADSALAVLPADVVELRATCRCRRAQVLAVMGQPGAADSIAAAMDAASRVDDPSARALCLRARGVHQWVHGFTDSSLVTYDSLAALRRRMHDRANLAVVLTLSADALRGQGDMGRAIPLFRTALAEARASHNLYIEATVTLGMGGIALTLNDHAAAARDVRQAIAAFTAADDSGSAMLARSFLPFVSLAAGDYPRARAQVQDVLPWARQVGDWSHVQELYTQLAAIEMRAGDWSAADRALDSAASVARRIGPSSEGTLLFPRGRLALYRGNLADAERDFTRYLAGLDSVHRMERYETRAYLADVYARRGDLAHAERELSAASDEVDAWRAGLADQELRTLVFQAGATESNDRNASVSRVIAALAGGGRADGAFALAERRRARELAERIARARALRADGDGARAADTTHRVATAASGDAKAVRPVSAADFAAAIPDDRTAVLEYVTGVMGAPTTLFVVTRRGAAAPNEPGIVRAYVLPPADSLVDDVARFLALVESGDSGALGRALGARLLDPALARLGPGVTRLVVVPDGPLHRVPWDALRLADGHYVAERYAVSGAPSATVLAELWRRSGHPTGGGAEPARLLAYGDPAFANERDAPADGEAESYRSAFDSAGGLPRLRASADEARLVARYSDEPEVRLRDAASAAYLKHGPLASFRVIHLATHALVDDRAVTRTALALAPGGGENGFVGASDLAALSLDADLVVLSACRSAGGVVVDGEGVQGLTAPLLQAGARAVVATGWRIGDRSTVAFVDEFYRAMAHGLPVGDALRAAKLDAIRRGAPPREWAAFAAVGDPLVTVPLRSPSPSPWRLWAVAAALALFGVVLAAYWLRGRDARAAGGSSSGAS